VVAPLAWDVGQNPPVQATEFKMTDQPPGFELVADLKDVQATQLGLTKERVLTIVGQKQGEPPTPYLRVVPLPDLVDETAITASLDMAGMLLLRLPRKPKEVK